MKQLRLYPVTHSPIPQKNPLEIPAPVPQEACAWAPREELFGASETCAWAPRAARYRDVQTAHERLEKNYSETVKPAHERPEQHCTETCKLRMSAQRSTVRRHEACAWAPRADIRSERYTDRDVQPACTSAQSSTIWRREACTWAPRVALYGDVQPACTSAQSCTIRRCEACVRAPREALYGDVKPAHDEKETVFDHAMKCEHYHVIKPYIRMNKMNICWSCLHKVNIVQNHG